MTPSWRLVLIAIVVATLAATLVFTRYGKAQVKTGTELKPVAHRDDGPRGNFTVYKYEDKDALCYMVQGTGIHATSISCIPNDSH